MPRRKVSFFQGGCYHIYNRGAGRQAIFQEDENYRFWLRRLKQYAAELDVSVIAYCLMPNHYHLLLRQNGESSAGRLAQQTCNSYSKAFNKRYDRTGTLFEGPYKAIHVDRDGYLLDLCRYIHANPVNHGLATSVEDWPYSNYLEWIGTRPGSLVDREPVREWFPEDGDYARFVQDYVNGRAALAEDVATSLME